MMELCINVDHPLEIGSIQNGFCLNENYEDTPICIRVIKPISLDEYVTFVTKYNLQHRIQRNIYDKYLYLVEILD